MLGSAGRLTARMAYPGGSRGRFNILMFHRVLVAADPLVPAVPDVAVFRRLMGAVRAHFNVVPLAEAVTRLRAGTLAPGSLSITFDDGYRDNLEVAAPVLRDLGLPATVFVATGFQSRPMMWNDCVIESVRRWSEAVLDLDSQGLGRHPTGSIEERRDCIAALLVRLMHRDLEERDRLVEDLCAMVGFTPTPGLMLREEDLPGLPRSGLDVGAHTVNHPILARLDAARARREMADSKSMLEDRVQQPVTLFAYPSGKPGRDYRPEHVSLAEEIGFDAAFSTVPGVASRSSDRFQIPRFAPWDHTPARFVAKLMVHGVKPGLVS